MKLTCVSHPQPWWQSAVIYQIYPRSFQDSDGDGVGDLAGIEARLDYLADLGVDAVWLSPIFPSPMADFGYDVADYTGIDPLFGDLATFEKLMKAAHARGLKLLLDLVPNHSSDQHPWFVESRASRDNPKRDWYIWRDAKPDGTPPNNWISDFGGSSWEWDDVTGQYYLHAFLKEQPDLNWRNPELRAAMMEVLRFWFDRGVDGFRIDVLWHIVKHADFPDNPPNLRWREGMNEMLKHEQFHSTDQPEVHDIAAEMRAIADEYGAVLVGEIYLPVPKLMAYYGTENARGVHLPFNFQLIAAKWDAEEIAGRIRRYEAALPAGGWPNWVLGNHDRPRVAARIGERQARVAAVLLLTLRGTPTWYYNDELCIPYVEIPPDRVRDPAELRQPGVNAGRDHARTPMAWDASANAGFSNAEPWLPVHDDWATRNVAVQAADPGSMLTFVKALLALRRAHPALTVGEIAGVAAQGDVLVYERRLGDERLVVALNLSGAPANVTLPVGSFTTLLSTNRDPSTSLRHPRESGDLGARGHVLGSRLRGNDEVEGMVALAPNEAIIMTALS